MVSHPLGVYPWCVSPAPAGMPLAGVCCRSQARVLLAQVFLVCKSRSGGHAPVVLRQTGSCPALVSQVSPSVSPAPAGMLLAGVCCAGLRFVSKVVFLGVSLSESPPSPTHTSVHLLFPSSFGQGHSDGTVVSSTHRPRSRASQTIGARAFGEAPDVRVPSALARLGPPLRL